jgi:hypothetical protein
MFKYAKIFLAIFFITMLCSCDDTSHSTNFGTTQTQDQQAVNSNSNLDKFVDVVEPFNDTEAQKAAFYQQDNNDKSKDVEQSSKN